MKLATNLPKPPNYDTVDHPDITGVTSIRISSGPFTDVIFCFGLVSVGQDNGDETVPLNYTYKLIEGTIPDESKEEFEEVTAAILFDIVETNEKANKND